MRKPHEQVQDAVQPKSKNSRWRSLALSATAALLCAGILLRLAGVAAPAWALLAAGAALAFVFILPALGGRMQEPADSPFKKVPWGS
jgi:hypothetical protein